MVRKTLLFVLGVLAICMVSCKKAERVSPTGKDLVLSPVELQKVTADNAFTLKLFKNLDSANTSNNNLFISPLSVSFAIGMTSNGSNGQTLAAIWNAMDFTGFTQDQVNNYYNKLINYLPQLDPNTTIDIANSIWYQQNFTVLPQFLQTNNSYYNAQIQALDFSSTSSVNTINNWVSSQTHGNIPTIIQQIPPGEVMYLINAIYFKSSWKEKFDPAATTKLPFLLADGSRVQTDFMSGTIDFNYFQNNDVNVFELPYSNGKYSMVIVTPTGSTTVQQLISGFDPVKWNTWITGLSPVKNFFAMPKFKFSYGTSLNNALTVLGMGIAFSNNADFSRINASTPLAISDVEHKAYVDVDESGTTAAAVTSVGVTLTASLGYTVSRPFMFVIREMSSGLIVFAGTVNNPLLTGN